MSTTKNIACVGISPDGNLAILVDEGKSVINTRNCVFFLIACHYPTLKCKWLSAVSATLNTWGLRVLQMVLQFWWAWSHAPCCIISTSTSPSTVWASLQMAGQFISQHSPVTHTHTFVHIYTLWMSLWLFGHDLEAHSQSLVVHGMSLFTQK